MTPGPAPETTRKSPGEGSARLWSILATIVIFPPVFCCALIFVAEVLHEIFHPQDEMRVWGISGVVSLIATYPLTRRFVAIGRRQAWSRKRGVLVAWTVVAVVFLTGEWFAASAILKIRRQSEEKSILSNVRQLSAAADEYFMQNSVSSVASANLVGSSNFLKGLNPLHGEKYPDAYTQGVTITVSGIGGTRVLTYAP